MPFSLQFVGLSSKGKYGPISFLLSIWRFSYGYSDKKQPTLDEEGLIKFPLESTSAATNLEDLSLGVIPGAYFFSSNWFFFYILSCMLPGEFRIIFLLSSALCTILQWFSWLLVFLGDWAKIEWLT